jgi:hypothetical protein
MVRSSAGARRFRCFGAHTLARIGGLSEIPNGYQDDRIVLSLADRGEIQ